MSEYLDTRDLADRLDELEALNQEADLPAGPELTELADLLELRDEIGDEWTYGATLIPVESFQDYARELAEDIGAVPTDYTWPTSCIDWERAADELAEDYIQVTYGGQDYFVRA